MSFGSSPFGAAPFASLSSRGGRAIVRIKATAFRKEVRASASVEIRARGNADFRVFAATSDYVTQPTDQLASRQFVGTLRQPLKFERSIIGSSRLGDLQVGFGEMILDNTEGSYDYLIRGYAIDGRRVVVKLGDARSAYDNFGIVFDGTASGWYVEEDQLRVVLRDYGYLLEKPVSPNSYTGAGELEGTEDLKGKRKPRLFGRCSNVSPPLVWPQKLIYQVNDGPVQAIPTVYSRAEAITFEQDYPTAAALAAATITSGKFSTCLAAGLFRVNFVLTGQITADVDGDKAGGIYARTTATIIRRLLDVAGIKADNVDDAKFAAVEAIQPALVGIFFSTDEETLVTGAIDQLIAGVGGWAGFRRDGRFEVGIVTLPENPPRTLFTEIEIIEIERLPLPEAVDPPPYRQRVAYARNWTVQTSDIAGVVTDARKGFLAEEYRLAESDAAQAALVKSDHAMAQDPSPVETFFALEADAKTEADRLFSMWRTQRSLYRLRLKTQPFMLDIGDTFAVRFDRWDLIDGKLLRVVSLSEDGETNSVELVGFG